MLIYSLSAKLCIFYACDVLKCSSTCFAFSCHACESRSCSNWAFIFIDHCRCQSSNSSIRTRRIFLMKRILGDGWELRITASLSWLPCLLLSWRSNHPWWVLGFCGVLGFSVLGLLLCRTYYYFIMSAPYLPG